MCIHTILFPLLVLPHSTRVLKIPQVAAGQPVKQEELRKYSSIFSDNFSVLSAAQQRPLLIATCKFLGLNAYGTNSFLKWQIRMKLNRIKRDDRVCYHITYGYSLTLAILYCYS